MGLKGTPIGACVDPIPLNSHLTSSIVCYPSPREGCDVARRVHELESIGVNALCPIGPARLDFVARGLRALGKGHSSIVVAALVEGGLAAVKIRRADSKRSSLASEALRLLEASRAGASPRVFAYSDDMILMEYLGFTRLEDVMTLGRSAIYVAMVEALRAARALDLANVLHQELHRPQGNVMYPYWPQSPRALVVDLESAAQGCGNVNKLVSFIVGSLLRLRNGKLLAELKEMLVSYTSGECPLGTYKELERLLVDLMKTSLGL